MIVSFLEYRVFFRMIREFCLKFQIFTPSKEYTLVMQFAHWSGKAFMRTENTKKEQRINNKHVFLTVNSPQRRSESKYAWEDSFR